MRIFRAALVTAILSLVTVSGLCAGDQESITVSGWQETQTVRPVLSAYTFEGGTAHMADTYLTPLHYNGWHVGFMYERMQAMAFSPERWMMQLSGRLIADHGENMSRNAVMWNLELEAAWTMMRRWNISIGAGRNLTLGIGPGTSLRAGALYMARNGNNPASAKGAWTVGANAYAAYNMRIGRLPVALRYECRLPVTGVFFAPQYGELYYEIWLGNTHGLARPAWWGNYFRMDNMLTADLRLGGTSIRLGYHADIISTKASHIVSRRITHAFMLGVATEWISLSHRHKLSDDARIIPALY
ncbi:MAG: DUF3316 domain-containing protein [Bacteroidales bacterium]|nr:DUF3316 domain-containing protein [Bacteroidales bacterium]